MAVGAADSSWSREGPDRFVGSRSVCGCWRVQPECPCCGPVLVAAGGVNGGWWREARFTPCLRDVLGWAQQTVCVTQWDASLASASRTDAVRDKWCNKST